MIIHDVEQNTPEWHLLRAGIPTASCFHQICSPTGKASDQAEAYSDLLIAEWMTSKHVSKWDGNNHSERGHEFEDEAAAYYEQVKRCKLEKIGFMTDGEMIDGKPVGITMGASPDRRVIGQRRLVEIKCPAPWIHVKYLRTQKIDQKYTSQLQGQLFVSGDDGTDIISYCEGFPTIIIPHDRDPIYIGTMGRMIKEFNEKLTEKKQRMIDLGYMENL